MGMRGFGEGWRMPVFHFTLHAYRSWNTDHASGYVQRGEDGVKLPNRRLASVRNGMARSEPVTFDDSEKAFLVEAAREAVERRGWELYGVTVIENHLHLVVGWEERAVDEMFVQGRLKRAFGFLMAQRRGTNGVSIFSRGGVPERVKGRRHLDYLLDEYFPKHHGAMWRHPRV